MPKGAPQNHKKITKIENFGMTQNRSQTTQNILKRHPDASTMFFEVITALKAEFEGLLKSAQGCQRKLSWANPQNHEKIAKIENLGMTQNRSQTIQMRLGW